MGRGVGRGVGEWVNGCAKSGVKCDKALLKKCIDLKENYHLALTLFNHSPRADGFSPSEMFHSRRVRSLLPEICW